VGASSESDPTDVIGVADREFQTAGSATARVWRALRNPRRIASYLMRKRGYKQGWDHLGSDQASAYAMVDSSADEAEFRQRGEAVARLLVDALRIDRTHRVLEIGCGPARIGRELAASCKEWIGADISREMIRRAEQRTRSVPNVSCVVLEGAALDSIGDASLDRVYCHSVLVHIDKEDVFRYLREIRRVLRPGGLAYVDTWNLLHEDSWGWFAKTVEMSPLGGRKESWRPQFSTTPELRRLIEKAGLAEILMIDESHLLQAFVGRPPSEADAPAWIAQTRAAIESAARAMIGLD